MSYSILDACCGNRTIWFQKQQSNTCYIDIRQEPKGYIKSRLNFDVRPNIKMDFRALGFRDNTFKLIVWDPPHLKTLGKTSLMRKKYGCLNAQTYPFDIRQGFSELWRVLQEYGTLILKWNTTEITKKEILACIPEIPLFGHTTGSTSKTMWFCFHKIPKEVTRADSSQG